MLLEKTGKLIWWICRIKREVAGCLIEIDTHVSMYRPIELSDMYDIISHYYLISVWALAYRRTIYPVPHMSDWIIPKEVEEKCPLPPDYKKKGRTREKRFPSAGERRPRPNKYVPNRNLGRWFNCSQGTEGS